MDLSIEAGQHCCLGTGRGDGDGQQTRTADIHEPRIIEIDTQRILDRDQHHFAVIDIGSNSIRLVVYDDLSRAPFPRFNEKSMCALGAGLDKTGRLSAEAIDRAVHALRRFDAIAKAMKVENVHVIATEATRRASNGTELIEPSGKAPASRPGC